MRKIVIYTMIGLCGYSAANASIVSRGFLDETLQSYVDKNQIDGIATAIPLACRDGANIGCGRATLSELFNGESIGDIINGILYNSAGGSYSPDGCHLFNLSQLTRYTSTLLYKIDDLPAEYETVGAAIRAINAKIEGKINNLSATASNGKYVLTAVKEGDQTTYAWESIDRSESENNAQ